MDQPQDFESSPDAFEVKLSAFDGPLDLLLHLIKRNEVSIYDIPIVLITQQYLDAIHLLQELNLDVAGDFLVMAEPDRRRDLLDATRDAPPVALVGGQTTTIELTLKPPATPKSP